MTGVPEGSSNLYQQPRMTAFAARDSQGRSLLAPANGAFPPILCPSIRDRLPLHV
jgi:hypothetical protein